VSALRTPTSSASEEGILRDADIPQEATSPPTGRAQDLAELWKNVLEAVGRVSPFARTYLLEAHPVSLAKNVLTIGFDPEFSDHVGLVDNSKNRTLLQTKMRELGCGEVQVKFVVANAPSDWVRPQVETADPPPPARAVHAPEAQPAKPEAPPAVKDDFKNDPLIKQALEIFKGTIVEVRA